MDETIFGIPGRIVILGVGLALGVIGLLWIRRLGDPGPLLRGTARWRYRDRGLRARIPSALVGPVLPDRTRGWWLTRIEFAIGIGAPVLVALLVVASPTPMGGGGSAPVLPTTIAGAGGVAFGLWWMVRIYRTGAREDARSQWRYRDR